MKTQPSKIYGYSKGGSKREVHGKTGLPQKNQKKDKKDERHFKKLKPPLKKE